MPRTFTPIATTTVPSSTQYITFTSIPNTYTDLFMVVGFISNAADLDYPTTWVGTGNTIDTGSNYSGNHLEAYAGGTAPYSYNNSTNSTLPYGIALSAGYYAQYNMWFYDYSATDKYKSMIADYGTWRSSMNAGVGNSTWRNTSAINTIRIGGSGGYNIATGSYATIWGVLKA